MNNEKNMNEKNKKQQQLTVLRHSTEHVLTQAMLKLYPNIKMAMGPAIENGFYFDFDPNDHKISEQDFPKIEKEMQKIIKLNLLFHKEEKKVIDAKKLFPDNPYKQEWLEEIQAKNEKATIYWTGKDFADLCSGPHIKSTGEIKAFKLLSVAGAYWRGDEKNKMLTRIYGTAFNNKKDLDEYLYKLEEAEKRNHRRLGKELELFAIFPEIGQGLPVWLPNGYRIRCILENYMLDLERKYGYVHILTPHINKAELFEKSGHLEFYKDSMYSPIDIDDQSYYLKPMNCPGGMMVYKMKIRSYRDLPIKLGELGTVYRYEKSGELHGLQRVRGFTQNDAHIFCTPEQLFDQFKEVLEMLKVFFRDLGFDNYRFILALSDPDKEKYKFCGKRKDWEWAENALRNTLKQENIEFEEQIGEAAFYGPKLDVMAINVFGKEDAISTIQVDFNLPERFELSYIDAKGLKQQPFVIHRALIGSFERFFAFLIEYYAGAFPLWLSPEQVWVMPISEKHVKYAQEVTAKLKEKKIRAKIKDESETLGKKIREGEMQKIPYLLVIGDKEVKSKTVNIRERGIDKTSSAKLSGFIEKVENKIKLKK